LTIVLIEFDGKLLEVDEADDAADNPKPLEADDEAEETLQGECWPVPVDVEPLEPLFPFPWPFGEIGLFFQG